MIARLTVTRALGLISIQDVGRAGHMHEAVPPSGALARDRVVAANRRVHNPDDAPALEVLGAATVRLDAIDGDPGEDTALAVATDTDTDAPRALAIGDELTVASEPRRVAYLAVRGGIAAPRVLGGRGALISAGLGGVLRAGHAL
ncbi:MAG TPA: hypothetical protein VFP84_08320, partial [Kofleriaceae bacterium]|nr:hypothetical protein [Kofleriaceae bacterium]